MSDGSRARRPLSYVPLQGEEGWLALVDDELLYRIQSLATDHPHDEELVAVVRSDRHFFVRQEAAKRIRDADRLKAFAADRHIGQILARQMRREADIAYLEHLIEKSCHLEVRKAAQTQLEQLRATLDPKG
jgi:ribosomal 50S subunit-associated protein YjgA (DUF615 family)